jgi:hypothetical protein
VERESDAANGLVARWPLDDGRNWSELVPIQPSDEVKYKDVSVWEGEGASAHDAVSGQLAQSWLRQIEIRGVCHNFTRNCT